MKQVLTIVLSLVAFAAAAHQEDVPITTAGELRAWCEMESHALFIGQGITPYNWSASYWDEGNVLFVEGSWRVGNKEAVIECRIARGAQTRYAAMSIDGDEEE